MVKLRQLEPCKMHGALRQAGTHWVHIPRIDNALYRAHDCDDCFAIVIQAMREEKP